MVKPVDTRRFAHLYPFPPHFADVGGFQYHYVDEGRGHPVVMLHGNPTWSFYFRNLIRGLAGHCRAIAPDHIGCGLSQKPDPNQYGYTLKDRLKDLEIFIEGLDLPRRLSMVVHDWGGMIGVLYALRHRERIDRLVITNTAAFLPPNARPIPRRLRLIRNSGRLARFLVLHLNLFARAALYMAPARPLNADVRAGLIAPYNCPANRIATLKFVQDIPLDPAHPSYALAAEADRRLADLRGIPMLIVWGRRDFVFDDTYLDAWRRRFPEARVAAFADAGHYLLEDVPEEAVKLISEFIRQK